MREDGLKSTLEPQAMILVGVVTRVAKSTGGGQTVLMASHLG